MVDANVDNADYSADDSMEDTVAIFHLPFVNDNPDGWGPNNLPEKFVDLPYQKFSKSDRIGKIADWTAANHMFGGHMEKKNYKYQPQFSVGNGQYSYFHDEDESQFTLVDQSKVVKTSYQKKIRSIQSKNTRRAQYQQLQFQKQQPPVNLKVKQTKKMKGFQPKNHRDMNQAKQREPSVKVKEDWSVTEEIDFSRLAKLSLPVDEEPVDLKICVLWSTITASTIASTRRLYRRRARID